MILTKRNTSFASVESTPLREFESDEIADFDSRSSSSRARLQPPPSPFLPLSSHVQTSSSGIREVSWALERRWGCDPRTGPECDSQEAQRELALPPFLSFFLRLTHPNSLLFFFGQDIERGFSSPDEGRAYRVSSTCLLFPVVPLPIPFSASSPPSPFFSSSSSRKSSLRSTSPQLSTPSNLEDSVTSTSSFSNSSLKVGTPSSFGTSESVEGKPLSCIDTQQTFSQSSASTWIS